MNQLICTSVDDARSSLGCMLQSDPARAAQLALKLLLELRGMDNQSSRRKVAAAALRKAATELEKSER